MPAKRAAAFFVFPGAMRAAGELLREAAGNDFTDEAANGASSARIDACAVVFRFAAVTLSGDTPRSGPFKVGVR